MANLAGLRKFCSSGGVAKRRRENLRSQGIRHIHHIKQEKVHIWHKLSVGMWQCIVFCLVLAGKEYLFRRSSTAIQVWNWEWRSAIRSPLLLFCHCIGQYRPFDRLRRWFSLLSPTGPYTVCTVIHCLTCPCQVALGKVIPFYSSLPQSCGTLVPD